MERVLELRAVQVDLARREVRRGDAVVPLSEREAELLAWLAAHPGEPADRDRLLVEVWGYPRPVATRAVDNTVSRLRSKIEADPTQPDHLRTVRGRGYVLDLPGRGEGTGEGVGEGVGEDPAFPRLAPPRSRFFGRREERARLGELVADGRRLVVVTGLGGAGKTRMVQQWLGERSPEPPLVAAVSCEAATSGDDLVLAVAMALRVPLARSAGDVAVLGRALRARGRALLVLDNLEQLVDVLPGTLGRWLDAAPELTVVATSRVRLGLRGEERLPLGPMLAGDALAFFDDRARAADPELRLPAADRDLLARLLARVDHHPLTISLLAARCALLSPVELLRRLDRELDGLDGGPRDAPARHQSLQATLRWSLALLDPPAQAALAACGAFAGGFDLDAAEAVLAFGPDAPAPTRLLTALREASLIERDRLPDGRARYSLLTVVQRFARRLLAARADHLAIEDRHAAHYADRGEAWLQAIEGPAPSAPRAARDRERANLLAAAQRVEARDPTTAARLLLAAYAAGGAHALQDRGPLLRLVEVAVAAGDAELEARAREVAARWLAQAGDPAAALSTIEPAVALARAGRCSPLPFARQSSVLLTAGELDAACALAQEGLAACRGSVHDSVRARLLIQQAAALQGGPDAAVAVDLLDRAIAIADAAGAAAVGLDARTNLAMTLIRLPSRSAECTPLLQEVCARVRRHGDHEVGAWSAVALAWSLLVDGDLQAAQAQAEHNEAALRATGDLRLLGQNNGVLAWIHALLGNLDQAERRLLDSLDSAEAVGDPRYRIPLYSGLAAVEARRDALAAAEAWLARAHAALAPDTVTDVRRGVEVTDGILDLARARAALARGDADAALRLRARAEERIAVAPDELAGSSYLRLVDRRAQGLLRDHDRRVGG